MWDLLLEPVLRVFGLIWHGDERTEARWFAVGCLTLILIVLAFSSGFTRKWIGVMKASGYRYGVCNGGSVPPPTREPQRLVAVSLGS